MLSSASAFFAHPDTLDLPKGARAPTQVRADGPVGLYCRRATKERHPTACCAEGCFHFFSAD
ncbi:hypothetical protein JL2886_00338 [Phaeobacter gallaeciensis]|uniref:Uncharacterized protein n=1 Tax=Phaeobacter gallaeciensis TaxID=60890 RepID=A0A1B0ZMD3_9RHOB|nr:hypothetical protein JL2886_00338 [Phaeobacter gallaeciensis]